jgi:hypothetical protein
MGLGRDAWRRASTGCKRGFNAEAQRAQRSRGKFREILAKTSSGRALQVLTFNFQLSTVNSVAAWLIHS